MMAETVRWGILGPGNIASDFFAAASTSTTGRIVALGARAPVPDLSRRFPQTTIHHGYSNLLRDPDVDAVYVALPHAFHAQWAVEAARHGKHVLCEKPMGMSATEAADMFAAAAEAETFMGEAFMYRSHPMIGEVLDLLRGGRIGDLMMLRSNFGFAASNRSPKSRLFDRSQGGGAVLDLGCYPASMVRLLAGYRSRDEPAEPVSLTGLARFGESGVDETASATMLFPDGVFAEIGCSMVMRTDNVLQAIGTTGRLEIDDFWFATGRTGGTMGIRLIANDGTRETITLADARNLYSFEFEEVNRLIRAGARRFAHPAMTEADSIGNARLIDRWLAAIGYHEEAALRSVRRIAAP